MKKPELKKQYYIAGVILLVLVVLLFTIILLISNSTDGAKFKSEYEKYNGETTSEGFQYQTLKIDKKNKVKYASLAEAVDLLKSGTGIIYFGMPDCPWCRGMVPTLLEKMDCSCLKELYYVDMTDARNTYEIEDDEPLETKKAEDAYYKALELLDEYLDSYTITDDDGVQHVLPTKRIYLPLVVAVKDGNVVGAHTGSVELNDTQSPYDELTEVQKSELEVIFSNLIAEVTKAQTICDDHC